MAPLFIGDELTAAAYRLAGLEVRVVTPAQAGAALADARRGDSPLVLITAQCAQAIPQAELDEALAAFAPPVALVADAAGKVSPPDFVQRVRAALSIAA